MKFRDCCISGILGNVVIAWMLQHHLQLKGYIIASHEAST